MKVLDFKVSKETPSDIDTIFSQIFDCFTQKCNSCESELKNEMFCVALLVGHAEYVNHVRMRGNQDILQTQTQGQPYVGQCFNYCKDFLRWIRVYIVL